MVDVNLWTILAATILAMVVGALWYGPLFGKLWLQVIGATTEDLAKRKEMQKKAMPLYLIQALLVFAQVFILAQLVSDLSTSASVTNAVMLWAAFVVPTLAGSSMWTNDSTSVKWTRFGLQAGYQFVVFVLFGVVLALWA